MESMITTFLPAWIGISARKVTDADTASAQLAGIKQLQQLFWVDPEHTHQVTGEMGSPRAFVIRPHQTDPAIGCRRFIYQLNRIQVDERGLPQDEDMRNPFAEIQGAVSHGDIFDAAVGLAGLELIKPTQVVRREMTPADYDRESLKRRIRETTGKTGYHPLQGFRR